MSALTVADATAVLAAERGDALAVLTMSAIAYWPDLREDDYRLMGLMGGAAGIGLGLALAQPQRRVLVVDGDGSLAMQLGVLTAIAGAAPPNLVHVVLDNGIYAISGGQPMPGHVDWPAMFGAAGYRAATAAATADELRHALRERSGGPSGIAVHCARQRPDYPAGAFSVKPSAEAARVRAALAP